MQSYKLVHYGSAYNPSGIDYDVGTPRAIKVVAYSTSKMGFEVSTTPHHTKAIPRKVLFTLCLSTLMQIRSQTLSSRHLSRTLTYFILLFDTVDLGNQSERRDG